MRERWALEAVETAPPSTMEVPEDFIRALGGNAPARKFFETLTRQNRYAILYRIAEAVKLENRQRRIDKYVAMLAAGETFH